MYERAVHFDPYGAILRFLLRLLIFLQAGDKVLELISTLLSITKSTQTPLRMVSLLDVAIGVLIRLKNVSDEPSHRLPQELKVGIFHG